MASTRVETLKEENPNPNFNQPQFLSREEVLRRRSLRLKKLYRVYRRHYWALVEAIRAKHRDYCWEFGNSPFEDENGDENERKRCSFNGCKSKAMPLTMFCHQHIMSDNKQMLYKACEFVTKSVQPQNIKCGKAVLRATVPCFCPMHYQKIQKQILQAFKKAGLVSLSRTAPKFHVIVAECVRQIQARRKALNRTVDADKHPDSSMKTNCQSEVEIGKNMPLKQENINILRGNDNEMHGSVGACEESPGNFPSANAIQPCMQLEDQSLCPI